MTGQKTQPLPTSSYREKKIGSTTYRITNIYLGEKDLKSALERLTVRRVLAEISAGTQA